MIAAHLPAELRAVPLVRAILRRSVGDPHHGLLWTHERARTDAPAWDLAACPRGGLP